jgi:hypothetical protein
MAEDVINVRIASDKKAALEAIAAQTDRDLSVGGLMRRWMPISRCTPGR